MTCLFCQAVGDVEDTPRSDEEWGKIWLHRFLKHGEDIRKRFEARNEPFLGGSWEEHLKQTISNLRAKLGNVL